MPKLTDKEHARMLELQNKGAVRTKEEETELTLLQNKQHG
jgi:hypothetical protein